MRKAYDTILQSEVSASLAAQNRGFEPYRYECSCCGEEVFIAAAHSVSMVAHFRHRSGNNDVECENYLGRFEAINIDERSRKSNRERVEFYFAKSSKTFNLGLRFSADEIGAYEQNNAVFELRTSFAEQPFLTLAINATNFAPEAPTLIPFNKFSLSYFLSNSHNGTKRKYDFFRPGKIPVFFKVLGYDSDYNAKLIRGTVLYTNTPYLVVFQSQYSVLQEARFSNAICVEDTFSFVTMGQKFLGQIITINDKTAQIDALMSEWGYNLEASETLTLLWPPAAKGNEVSLINTSYAFLYSSFELQAHGNINTHSDDIHTVTDKVSRVLVTSKIKVFKKNAEIILARGKEHAYVIDEIVPIEKAANMYIVPDDNPHFLFNRSGVKRLSKGQSVYLTPQAGIVRYYCSYPINRVYYQQQKELAGEDLLKDILSHYRRIEPFERNVFNSCLFTKTAAQYVERCEASGLINTVAKHFIEEGWL